MAVCDNGGGYKTKLEIERRDLLKLAGIILGVLSFAAATAIPLMLYVFQTRSDAIVQHAAIEQAAALHEQQAELLRAFDQERLSDDRTVTKDMKAILRTLDQNQRALMREAEVPRRKITPLPSGVSFDDLDLDNP